MILSKAWHSFEWYECGEPPTDARIADVERAFGVRFPAPYLSLIRMCDGGEPQDCCFSVKHPGGSREWKYGFGRLLSFRAPMPRAIRRRMSTEPDAWRGVTEEPWSSIEEYAEALPPGMEHGLVPFSDNGLGDFLCFDYRRDRLNHDPAIVLWLHEFTDDDPVVRLADNFEQFLSKLGPCEPAKFFGPREHLNRRTDD
jgi:cell wall assembly regulator SMI1